MELSSGKYQSVIAKAVKVLSPETSNFGKADGFHLSEGRMKSLLEGVRESLPRGLRQRYDITRKSCELGRTLSCCSVKGTVIRNKLERQQGLDEQDKVVGSVHSSNEAGNDRGAKGQIFVRNVAGRQDKLRRGQNI